MRLLRYSLLALCCALFAGSALAAPIISATKDDNVASGQRKLPGNTITYTTTITNSGDAMATSVQFSDPDPANTTFVSVNSTPIARADSYSAIGNVQITIPAASGLLANDNDADDAVNGAGAGLTAAAGTTSTQSGNLTVNANGSFTYNPAPGFTGTDTFTYTLTDQEGSTDTATVTITVTGTIWFINAALGTNGDGRLSAPFNSVANYTASAPSKDAGDNIFLYSGTYTGLTLGTNQRLIGQGAVTSLAAVTGLTPPTGSLALPATGGTRPTIAVSSGTGITLGNGNTVNGLNVTNSNGSGITGSAVGTLTLADFDVTVTGGLALSLTTSGTVTATGTDNDLSSTNSTALNVSAVTIGAAGMTFKSVATSGGTSTGINLSGIGSGFLTVTGTGTTAGSGGTIQNISNADAVRLNTTDGLVTLKNMIIQDITASTDASAVNDTHSNVDGIHGTAINAGLTVDNVTFRRISDSGINGSVDGGTIGATVWNGLTITNCFFDNTNRFNVASHGDATDEGAVFMRGLKGSVSVTGTTFQNASSGLFLQTDTSGTMDMTVRSNSFLQLYKEVGTLSIGLFGIDVRQEGSLTSTIRIGDTAGESSAALGNTFTNGGDRAGIRIITNTGSTGSLKVSVAKNTLTVTDHSSPGQAAGNTIYNFPQSGVLYRALGTGNFEGIFAANTLNELMHADGGLGQLSLLSERGATEFVVRNNTFNKPWDAPVELRADGQNGGQTCQVLFNGNTYIDGIVGDGTTDLGGQSPYEGFYTQVRNNGRMDFTMQNEATPLGLTDSSSTINTSLHILTTSSGDILNLFLQNIQSPRGYRLQANASTTFNLYRNGSASGTLQGVLQDNGDRGGGGVDTTNPPTVNATGTITLSNSAPALPSITAPLLFAAGGVEAIRTADVSGKVGFPPAASGVSTDGPSIAEDRSAANCPSALEDCSGRMPEPGSPIHQSQLFPFTTLAGRWPALPKTIPNLTQFELDALVIAARECWAETGLTSAQIATLRNLKFAVADLPGWHLGEAGGDRIRVDRNAGGHGWFVGAAAEDDALFLPRESVSATRLYTDPASAPAGHIDLLSAILHEMGHALGLEDTYAAQDRDSLMYGFLTEGERRLPATGQAAGATPHAEATPHFLSVPLTIGDLPPGKAVTITYVVTINAATTAISTSSQGTVSGGGFSAVSTQNKDGATTTGGATVTQINQPPTVTNVAVATNEDATLTFTAANFTGSYSDLNSDPLVSVRIVSLPAAAAGTLKVGAANAVAGQDVPLANLGTITFVPAANFNGAASFSWNASDGTVLAATAATVNITVTAVNDVPSFTKGADQTVNEDAGAQSVANWATAISAGPADESGQALNFLVSNNNNPLFSAPPAVAANGTLTYTPAANANGSATVSVQIHDNGGVTNGGVDTSAVQTFTITVVAVNDPPIITGQNAIATNEDTARTIAFGDLLVTDVDHPYPTGFTLTVQPGTNYTRVGNTITPALNYNGVLTVPVTVSDPAGALSNVFNLSVTVTSVNDNPVAAADTITRYEGQSTKVLITGLLANDTDVDGGTVAFASVASTSAGGQPVSSSGGYVFYTPGAGFTGADTFTYTISDGQGGTATGTVTVQVTVDNGESQNKTIEILPNGSARVVFAGIPGRSYRVQSTDSLTPATWTTRATSVANAQGAFEFTDPAPLPPSRFYRSINP